MTIELADEPVTAPDVLAKAKKHMEDRAATYDKPEGERSMAQTVAVFNVFHGTNLTEAQGWHFMEILKRVRLFSRPGFHQDSAEDAVAYGALLAEAKAREVEPVAVSDWPTAFKLDHPYEVGDLTMEHIFKPCGLTNLSNMQAILNRVEDVLASVGKKV